MIPYRFGIGYDVHQLVTGRDLIVGGVLIPHDKGALGHSDADVLIHAIADALLGALALGDIGHHFPDTDLGYKDIKSSLLLTSVVEKVREKGYRIGNIDASVVLQTPKINKYIPQMIGLLAEVMGVDSSQISIKATTTEKMGFIGHEKGIAAYVVAGVYIDT